MAVKGDAISDTGTESWSLFSLRVSCLSWQQPDCSFFTMLHLLQVLPAGAGAVTSTPVILPMQ